MRVSLLKHQSQLFSSEPVAQALRSIGWDVSEATSAKSLPGGSILLAMGLYGSERSPEAVAFLREARERGVTRILWQLEPTLPPKLSGRAKNIIDCKSIAAASQNASTKFCVTPWHLVLGLSPGAGACRLAIFSNFRSGRAVCC